MWNWIEQYHLGRLTSEERLAEEEQHRRLVRFSRFGQLPLVVTSLLVIFT
jgi:hypothetical protein